MAANSKDNSIDSNKLITIIRRLLLAVVSLMGMGMITVLFLHWTTDSKNSKYDLRFDQESTESYNVSIPNTLAISLTSSDLYGKWKATNAIMVFKKKGVIQCRWYRGNISDGTLKIDKGILTIEIPNDSSNQMYYVYDFANGRFAFRSLVNGQDFTARKVK